jgi:hypothetical protein
VELAAALAIVVLAAVTPHAAAQLNCGVSDNCNPATQQCDVTTGICWCGFPAYCRLHAAQMSFYFWLQQQLLLPLLPPCCHHVAL